ncbi:hypothetical protein THRCLA_21694, partial [Thraustotheca clavata]
KMDDSHKGSPSPANDKDSVPMLRPRALKQNNSDTESDSESSQRTGSFSESETQPVARDSPPRTRSHQRQNSNTDNNKNVPNDIKRTGAMLTSLLSSSNEGENGVRREIRERPTESTNTRNKDGEGLQPLHAADVRLPALSMGSFLRQNPPQPATNSLPPSTQLNELHMRGPMPPQRVDMQLNRPSVPWPPTRPQLEPEGTGNKRSNSPPRTQYPTPTLSVQPPREEYDYPTYQPPEALVGQRIAKTFAGHGRFVGQVVKFNPQTELFTVVYADGDTEELTRENTMNLLIEDKRIHGSSKPREQAPPQAQPMLRKPEVMQQGAPAPIAQPNAPSTSGYKLSISDRELDILTSLFEKHAWPLLAEHGWTSEMHGASYFFYPPWAGKSTREPEYFNSVLDAMKYISMHADLMRLCFPPEIQSTILSIFDQNKSAPNGPGKRQLDNDTPLHSKRTKPDSPPSTGMPRGAPTTMLNRPGYYDHPQQQQQQQQQQPPQQHPMHGGHPYDYQAADNGMNRSALPASTGRYPARMEEEHEFHHRMASTGPLPSTNRSYPSPSGRQASPRYAMGSSTAVAPSSRPQMFHENYSFDRSRAPPPGYLMPSPRHHVALDGGVPRGVPSGSRMAPPPGYTESPRETRLGTPNGAPSSGMRARIMYPPGSAPPQSGPPSNVRDPSPTLHGRYAPTQPSNPRGPIPRANMISMSDLDKSTPMSSRLQPPPPQSTDNRMRMFPGESGGPGNSYPSISSNRMPPQREWEERAPGYPDQGGFRREERSLYPPQSERYAMPPPPSDANGYYDRAPPSGLGAQRYPPGAFPPPPGNPVLGANSSNQETREYQYSRRM